MKTTSPPPRSASLHRRLAHPQAVLAWLGLLVSALLPHSRLGGQTCFVYSDTVSAPVPISCVQKANHSLPCAWPTDCDSIVSASGQTILRMHTLWHNCFGNVGGSTPPVGRGNRWYAFHRQFEYDFNLWREGIGFAKIESLNWCSGMNMPIGHPSAMPGGIPGHPAGCGVGNPRPDDVTCAGCEAFPPCLFYAGAGPSCPGGDTGDSSWCPAGITALEQFANTDEVAKVLDRYFHGRMHTVVGDADGSAYVQDIKNPNCSPRDPMFWRLHKALDDVVRAWQDHKAVDVMVVIDRSGSMSDPDAGGPGNKLDAALDAAQMFADLLDTARTDGAVNRIGIVAYGSTATSYLPLTAATSTLLNPAGPLLTALNNIRTAGPGGCTGIGLGIQKALDGLCGGNCDGYVAPAGENSRKAILLLTDGIENIAPCLVSSGPAGGSCGGQCFGATFDYNRLKYVQLCAVGFGESGSLDGDKLTLLAERQGGIYTQNPNSSSSDDLKKFFVTGFGQLTDEFLLADPAGFLAASDPASAPVTHQVCDDSKLTFAGGWKTPIPAGGLRLIVTSPAGNLVPASGPGQQSSTKGSYSFQRLRLPYRGEAQGTWTAHLIRPHQTFVNGFTTDSFKDISEGVRIVRRQIQRLIPNGARAVLFFEDGLRGPESAYETALKKEVEARLIPDFTKVSTAAEFLDKLAQAWELIVYAHQAGSDKAEAYDGAFAGLLCQGQRAILTDTRTQANAELLRCAGALRDGTNNWKSFSGDGRLFDGTVELVDPGYPIFSYGLRPAGSVVQATANPAKNGAIIARASAGVDENWFVGILGRGLSKLDPHLQQSIRRTGDDLIASARILPSYYRAGGYDRIDARVEVEYPLDGLGNMVAKKFAEPRQVAGEFLDRRAASVAALTIPTGIATFPLFDDGTHGDLHPNNRYWTSTLPGIGRFDGMYRFRFIFDFTVGNCTTRREMMQSVFMDTKADPGRTGVTVGPSTRLPDGRTLTSVRILPRDAFGNLWGPGRIGSFLCDNPRDCAVDPQGITDLGDGSYSFNVITQPGVPAVRLNAFNAPVDIVVPCTNCPRLASFTLSPDKIEQFQPSTGLLRLSGPAASGSGALVYLSSSDGEVASVPPSVLIPANNASASFVISNAHGHGTKTVWLTARYGGDVRSNLLTVVPSSAPPVPFEIDTLARANNGLRIDFTSPFLPDMHQVQLRTRLDGTNRWTSFPATISGLGNYRFRATVPLPPGPATFYRVINDTAFPATDTGLTTPAKPLGDAGPDAAVPLKQSAWRKTPALSIPDNSETGVVDTFQFPDDLAITDVNVYLNLSHPWVGDLVIELTSPEGTVVTLRDRTGSPQQNIQGWCGAPGSAERLQLQKLLIGQRAAGVWKIRVRDLAGEGLGQLNEWGIAVTGFGDPGPPAKMSAAAAASPPAPWSPFPRDWPVERLAKDEATALP